MREVRDVASISVQRDAQLCRSLADRRAAGRAGRFVLRRLVALRAGAELVVRAAADFALRAADGPAARLARHARRRGRIAGRELARAVAIRLVDRARAPAAAAVRRIVAGVRALRSAAVTPGNA